MTQNTQSELDAAEVDAADGTEMVDIGGFSQYDGFTEESDESTDTDCTPLPTYFEY